MSESRSSDLPAPLRHHPRQWRNHVYVYPVISRRGGGVSIGVNLSQDKHCTFSCAYCQVKRGQAKRGQEPFPGGSAAQSTAPGPLVEEVPDSFSPCAAGAIDLARLRKELVDTILDVASGALWKEERFAATPELMRKLHDIAFSGDGEPTLLADFDKALAVAADVRRELRLPSLKIVIITNASCLHLPPFRRALPMLSEKDEIWAKLDAGTEELFQRINRPVPVVTLRRILDNILDVARRRPVVIQGLFLRMGRQAPAEPQLKAWCDRLRELVHAGGKIQLVQVYTVARAPADATATALTPVELQAIAQLIRAAVPGVPVEAY